MLKNFHESLNKECNDINNHIDTVKTVNGWIEECNVNGKVNKSIEFNLIFDTKWIIEYLVEYPDKYNDIKWVIAKYRNQLPDAFIYYLCDTNFVITDNIKSAAKFLYKLEPELTKINIEDAEMYRRISGLSETLLG